MLVPYQIPRSSYATTWLFYQVFTIYAFVHGQQFPLTYGLLPGKSRETYKFFMGVKQEAMQHGINFSPEEIMADFELALVQWHNRMKKISRKAHPHLYQILELFQRKQAATEVTIQQLETGGV